MGGFVDQFKGGDTGGVLYLGPEWYTAPANNSILGAGVNPGRKNDPFDYYKQGYRPY
jgi:hypothetical protein